MHADPEAEQWCVVMESTAQVNGGETLEMLMRKGVPEKGKIRQAFIRVCRAVQSLHHAGLVHNAICAHNVIDVKSGMKLGNFSKLQRQGENTRMGGTKSPCSPERSMAEHNSSSLKCDFATDVWALGLLLHELCSGVVWDAGRPPIVLSEELLDSDLVLLPALDDKLEGDEEGEAVKALVRRMLTKHPMQRPVVDVILQEAIQNLYVEHELDTVATLGPPLAPPSPKRERVASPPLQRPTSSSVSSSSSPVMQLLPDACEGAVDPAADWDGLSAKHGIEGTRVEEPPPACDCRCVTM